MLFTNLEIAIGQKFRELAYIRRFEASAREPRQTQLLKLLSIVENNQDTAFGRKHRFGAIRSVEDFQSAVPPCTYEDLFPYIEREMNGEKGQLTQQEPVMFATTSGTTDKPKYIPITPAHLRDYTDAFQVHNYQLIKDHQAAARGRFLVISSSDEEGRTAAGIPYGAVSGVLCRNQPAILRRHFALPYQLGRIKDIDTKYYLMLRLAVPQNVSAILCCNPSSLLVLADQLRLHGEDLVADIRDGKVSRQFAVPEPTLAVLAPYLKPDRPAARALERILEADGALAPARVWAQLGLISCWKGGPMGFYLEQLPDHFGDVPVRDLGYMASEGRGSIPLTDEGAGGVLAVSSHFFEFVPEEDCGRPQPRFLTADRLDLDRRYYIYFTTASGLYRYNINDLVEVVGFFANTPVIQFVRKSAGFSSITGEKLTEEQVRIALSQTVKQLDLSGINHFTAAVQLARPPFYRCFVEIKGEMSDSLKRDFLHLFDLSLKSQNPEYRDKRDSHRLGRPRLLLVPAGTFARVRQKRVLEGAPEAQVKIPLLTASCDYMRAEVRRAV